MQLSASALLALAALPLAFAATTTTGTPPVPTCTTTTKYAFTELFTKDVTKTWTTYLQSTATVFANPVTQTITQSRGCAFTETNGNTVASTVTRTAGTLTSALTLTTTVVVPTTVTVTAPWQ